HSVGVMEFEKKRADHVVQTWTEAAARYDPGTRLFRIEKQLRARSGQLKQLLRLRRCRRIAYNVRRNSCLFANRVPQWRRKSSLTERSCVHVFDFIPRIARKNADYTDYAERGASDRRTLSTFQYEYSAPRLISDSLGAVRFHFRIRGRSRRTASA